jgi:hypothetical protein
MDEDVHLICDDQGLIVIGPPSRVAALLAKRGLTSSAKTVNLRRFWPRIGILSEVADAGIEQYANSARWLKLTPESAALRKQFGLIETDSPDVFYALIGEPGKVKKWAKVEAGPGSGLTNPAVMSGVAGIMAQVAMQQQLDEIKGYLIAIDMKVDDVIRKVDDARKSDMVGVGRALDRAMTLWDSTGVVSAESWSTVDQAPSTIEATQDYAMTQLEEMSKRLVQTNVSELAKAAADVQAKAPQWLAILAYCFEKQVEVDMLQVEREFVSSPDKDEECRRALREYRKVRREAIIDETSRILDRMDVAVGRANAKIFWNHTDSPRVVFSANEVSRLVGDFNRVLELESVPRVWEIQKLGALGRAGSQTVQKAKDHKVELGAAVLTGGAFLGKQVLRRDRS